jgi:VanZ family protein
MKRDRLWPILIVLTVFVVSGQSEVAVPSGFNLVGIDKVAHFGVFGALATSLIRLPEFQRRGRKGAWMVILLVSIYGGLDEWRQSFTPGRFMEFDDWIADTLGAITAVVLYTRWPAWRRLLETPIRKPS